MDYFRQVAGKVIQECAGVVSAEGAVDDLDVEKLQAKIAEALREENASGMLFSAGIIEDYHPLKDSRQFRGYRVELQGKLTMEAGKVLGVE